MPVGYFWHYTSTSSQGSLREINFPSYSLSLQINFCPCLTVDYACLFNQWTFSLFQNSFSAIMRPIDLYGLGFLLDFLKDKKSY